MIEDFIAELMEWVDTPFHAHQNVKKLGCDCTGLVVGVLREIGRPDYFNADDLRLMRTYKPTMTSENLSGVMKRNFIPIPARDAVAGDLVTIKFTGRTQHLAVLLPAGKMIHSRDRTGKVVVEDYSSGWRKRTVLAYRLKSDG